MTLGELIEALESKPADMVIRNGFTDAHSYRGWYEELAFKPCGPCLVGDMLREAKQAVGSTYTGYKGGEYLMSERSDVYLAEYGDLGEELGPRLLAYMLADEVGTRTESPPSSAKEAT